MSRADRMDRYLRRTLNALEDDGFAVFEDERYRDRRFRAVAVKEQGFGLGNQELVFVFSRSSRLTADMLDDFVEDAYAYAKESRKATWPIGMGNLLWVYAVALTEEASDRVVGDVREEEPRIQGLGYVAFPVVYDAGADEVYFHEAAGGLIGGRGMSKVARVAEDYLALD